MGARASRGGVDATGARRVSRTMGAGWWRWIPGPALLMGLLLMGTTPASASGGGGCGRPVTDARGTTVAIRQFCFRPTVLRVRPGATVTFVNHDPVAHTILGANGAWGSFDALRGGNRVAYRFTRSGVYSYVCTLHPGMVGTVVIGGGRGPGAFGTTSAAGPVTPVTDSPAPQPASRPAPELAAGSSAPVRAGAWPAVTAVSLALFVLATSGLALERRRRARG